MISDIRQLDEGTTIESDLCIVGGGVAAIAMAHQLSGSKLDICILESGGLRLDRKTQSLSAGEADGIPYFDLIETRYRMLGGSTYRCTLYPVVLPLGGIGLQARR